jgi:hypothetical protein
MDVLPAYQVASFNASIHGLIDAYIWNLYKWQVMKRLKALGLDDERLEFEKNNFEYWKDKGFYTTIGLDQFLHHATIVLVVWMVL